MKKYWEKLTENHDLPADGAFKTTDIDVTDKFLSFFPAKQSHLQLFNKNLSICRCCLVKKVSILIFVWFSIQMLISVKRWSTVHSKLVISALVTRQKYTYLTHIFNVLYVVLIGETNVKELKKKTNSFWQFLFKTINRFQYVQWNYNRELKLIPFFKWTYFLHQRFHLKQLR